MIDFLIEFSFRYVFFLEEWKKHSLVGFAFTESLLLILKNEVDWLDYETSEKHDNDLTIEHEMKLVDLVSAVSIFVSIFFIFFIRYILYS